MTTQEWRSKPELASLAHEALKGEVIKDMIALVESESPFMPGVNLFGSSDGDKMTFLGRELGYREAIAKLKSLAIQSESPKHLEATFEPEHNFIQPMN
jgi:hypothetical protein